MRRVALLSGVVLLAGCAAEEQLPRAIPAPTSSTLAPVSTLPPAPTSSSSSSTSSSSSIATTAISATSTSVVYGYTVQPGDTLADLAERFGTTVDAIIELNGLEHPESLIVGWELVIPTD